ncbi:MAG: hypothetical protein WBA93_19045 [Microcoleaceae cyanobacterium]
MKQNIIALGLIASAGLTFFPAPKATAWNSGPSVGTSIEESQTVSYTGNNEDGQEEEIETGKKTEDR